MCQILNLLNKDFLYLFKYVYVHICESPGLNFLSYSSHYQEALKVSADDISSTLFQQFQFQWPLSTVLEPLQPFSHSLGLPSDSSHCCWEQFCDSLLADCISPQVPSSFQLGLLKQVLLSLGWEAGSSLLGKCTIVLGSVGKLMSFGTCFYLWSLELIQCTWSSHGNFPARSSPQVCNNSKSKILG